MSTPDPFDKLRVGPEYNRRADNPPDDQLGATPPVPLDGQPLMTPTLTKWLPIAAIILVSILLLFSGLKEAIAAQRRPQTTDLGEMLYNAIQSTSARAIPLKVMAALTLPAVLAGFFMVILFAWRRSAGRRLIESEWEREPRWSGLDVLLATIGPLVAVQLLLPAEPRGSDHPPSLMNESVLYILILAAVLLIVKLRRRGDLASLGLRRHRFARNVGRGLLAYLCVLPILLALMLGQNELFRLLRIKVELQQPVEQLIRATSAGPLIAFSVMAVIVAPFIEELYFRAFLQGMARKRCGSRPAIIAVAFLFAAVHANVFAFLPLFVLGLTLGYLYDKTQSLAAPVTLHVCQNAFTVAFLSAVKFAQN